MLEIEDVCQHEVYPIDGDPDWGECIHCGATDFPMTDAAAYGPVDCEKCHDIGIIPVSVEGGIATRKDGSTYVISGAFASAACPDCGYGFDFNGKAVP